MMLKSNNHKCLVLLFVWSVIFGSSRAAALTSEELTQSLYIKLARVVMPNGNDLRVGKSYFIIANPGIIVGNPSDLTGEGYQQMLISQIDAAPKKDPFFEPGLHHLATLYKTTIDSLEVPHPEDEEAKLKLYDELQKQKKETLKSSYKEYNELRDAINTANAAVDNYVRQQADLKGIDPSAVSVPLELKNARVKAQKNLKDFSNLPKIAALEDKLATIETSLPVVFKERLRQQYADRAPGGGFPAYVFFPSPNNWGKTSWTKYKTNDSELSSYSKDEFKSSSGGLGGNTSFLGGFLGGSVSNNKQETWKYSDVESKKFNLEFELTRVGVFRPWLDPVFFTSRRWRMPANGDMSCHVWSRGTASATDNSELAPFVVKSIILSKNLKISGDWTKDIKKEYDMLSKSGGHVRWGFFSVGGDKSHTVSEKESKALVSGSTIENNDIQIIGFVVEPLGVIPNPDPSQAWATAAANCK
jgi:hypothetical protein